MSRCFSYMFTAIVVIGVFFVIGCGYDPEKPVYDTSANPDGFPEDACQLLDRVEAGQLATFDLITEAFADLYLDHQELLENRKWHDVIGRLGSKFTHRADELTGRGVNYYSQAAGFYSLASFARPGDREAEKKSALFATWERTVKTLGAGEMALLRNASLADRLGFLRHFVFGDEDQRRFAAQYLTSQLIDPLLTGDQTSKLALRTLSKSDKAFLEFLPRPRETQFEPVARWNDPDLELIAYNVTRLDTNLVRAEIYLTPSDSIRDGMLFVVSPAADVQAGEAVSESPLPMALNILHSCDSTRPSSGIAVAVGTFDPLGQDSVLLSMMPDDGGGGAAPRADSEDVYVRISLERTTGNER